LRHDSLSSSTGYLDWQCIGDHAAVPHRTVIGPDPSSLNLPFSPVRHNANCAAESQLDTGMPLLLSARAPVRVDLGGGWTDVPPYCEEKGGYVCNIAVARYATATLHASGGRVDSSADAPESAIAVAAMRRSLGGNGGLRLHMTSDYPIGAGLGGSSAAGVAALAALAAHEGRNVLPEQLAEESRAIEVEDLGVAGGRQDHYAAAFGGALGLEFGGGVRVKRIPIEEDVATRLESRMLILYTGRARVSGATIQAVMDAYREGSERVTAALQRMQELARQMAIALQEGRIAELGALVGEQWIHQRSLHTSISTPEIEQVMSIAAREGAWGAKALGASGGGCVLVLGEPETLGSVEHACKPIATALPFGFDYRGVQVTPGGVPEDTVT
jgi:D-glycero-alpha-D-manno-heptose-7-phosphate kinase